MSTTRALTFMAEKLRGLVSTNKHAEELLEAMQKEHAAIARMLGATPRADYSIDWYRGRMGVLQELIDGMAGTNDGN